MRRIAVLIACYNRKEKTLACLDALFGNELPANHSLDVFLVDDGSTDGTSASVSAHFPQVKILHGNGELYWNGGMRLAFSEAMKDGFDYYLWLNDDTTLFPAAIQTLLETQQIMLANTGGFGMAVGSTCDDDGKVTYGGKLQSRRNRPLNLQTIEPGDKAVPCTTMNGNCVLIHAGPAKLLENLDAKFVHTMGDIDYGLRASRAGIPVWIMPGFVGRCIRDKTLIGSHWDGDVSLSKRLKHVLSPKNFPLNVWFVFCRRHGGWAWPLSFISPYVKAIFAAPRGGKA